MANVKEYGELLSSDILVIGGGFAGLVTAIKAKETNPELDVLVVDKGFIGWSGQATKAGNGIRATKRGEEALQKAMGYLVNSHTEYLNDQIFLKKYLEVHADNIEYMNHCGLKLSINEDGTVSYFPMIPGALDAAGVELNTPRSLRAFALKVGVRLLSRVNVFELLTNDDGRVIGAIGFDMDKGECKIFQTKAVAMATHGCHFKKVGLQFMAYGTGVGAAYRAGAVMRNVEFANQTDIVYTKSNTPIYGGFNLIHNRHGENISKKYCPQTLFELSPELVMGMLEEIKQGNGPLWCDLENPDEVRKIIGGQGHQNEMRMLRDKIDWVNHVYKKTERAVGDMGLTPEVTIKMVLQVEPIKVDIEYKTDVEGLWAPGKISTQGSAYFGWTRGDGLGNASTTGMMAGLSMAKYAAEASLEKLCLDQVKAYKEKIYAPLHRKTGRKPQEIFDIIESYVFSIDKMLAKNEEVIRGILKDVEDMKKIIPELSADDPHTLAKCLEAADTVLCLEMIYRAADMRKETRGKAYPHYRTDYPERDDKNWLKWINIQQGVNGEMELFTEDVPLWKYPIRPEGYEIPEGQKEEFYVNPIQG